VARLNWAEVSQEKIESVVDHLKIVDVCNHFALCFEGPSICGVEAEGRESRMKRLAEEIKWFWASPAQFLLFRPWPNGVDVREVLALFCCFSDATFL
jgi:hypothetical protein